MKGDDTTFELCIVLDSTGSMGKWIQRAKNSIHDIINRLVEDNQHMGNTMVRVALIGYRDVLDKGRFMEMEFTQNIDDVKQFLGTFIPTTMEHNVDRPEDVAGGLKLALMQDWTFEGVKRCVLITDAPGHGFYTSKYANQDNYPMGTPDVPSLQELVMEFSKKDIALQVCKLEENMTDMIQAMKMWNVRVDVMELNKIPMPDYDQSSDDDDEF